MSIEEYQEVRNGITYTMTIDPDDVSPAGEFASGDDEADARTVAHINERLSRGDAWAWCSVDVTASIDLDGEEFTGVDSLGGCCYESAEDFRKVGPYEDMVEGARMNLLARLEQESAGLRAKAAAELFRRFGGFPSPFGWMGNQDAK